MLMLLMLQHLRYYIQSSGVRYKLSFIEEIAENEVVLGSILRT